MRAIIFAVIATIGGIGCYFSGADDSKQLKKFESEGVTVKGEIQSGESVRSGRRSRNYNLVVSYTTKEERKFNKTFKVSSSFFNSVGENGVLTTPEVDVIYLPSNPGEAIIKDGTPFSPELQWVGPLIAVGGVGYLGHRFKRAATA